MEASPDQFRTEGYRRHNRCRQEHLTSLDLDLCNKTVLELGAGIGDHTQFWLDRNCQVTCVEARSENVRRIKERHPTVRIIQYNLESSKTVCNTSFHIVYAYGILYHLSDPLVALQSWAGMCSGLLLLETCVNRDESCSLDPQAENQEDPTASFIGLGCRPSRRWVWDNLLQLFPHVYVPKTQPNHEEFPNDWNGLPATGLIRAVFVASQQELVNHKLLSYLPSIQEAIKC